MPAHHDLKKEFASCKTSEEIYLKVIEWGKKLPTFDPAWKVEENRVEGCQSVMYLHTEVKEKKLYFAADSDALISKGLAMLLITLYNGATAEYILKNPPTILDEIGLTGALSPGRANGLSGLYLKMKQEALKSLLK